MSHARAQIVKVLSTLATDIQKYTNTEQAKKRIQDAAAVIDEIERSTKFKILAEEVAPRILPRIKRLGQLYDVSAIMQLFSDKVKEDLQLGLIGKALRDIATNMQQFDQRLDQRWDYVLRGTAPSLETQVNQIIEVTKSSPLAKMYNEYQKERTRQILLRANTLPFDPLNERIARADAKSESEPKPQPAPAPVSKPAPVTESDPEPSAAAVLGSMFEAFAENVASIGNSVHALFKTTPTSREQCSCCGNQEENAPSIKKTL